MKQFITSVKMNGINIVTLHIIGNPNTTGSLTPNKAGIIDNFPTYFIVTDLDFNSNSTNPNVAPEPPIPVNPYLNAILII